MFLLNASNRLQEDMKKMALWVKWGGPDKGSDFKDSDIIKHLPDNSVVNKHVTAR